jgi:tripartite-type tricarboxylate transporter receptor subunit TctC
MLSALSTVVGLACLGMSGAWAAYPDRPLKLVVPFSPGGGTDSITRALAVGLAQALGQAVVVDNKPGAGTVIGTDAVAKSAPDGYTLVMATFAHAVNPSLVARLPFDTERAFAAVGMVARGPNVLVVRADSALKTLRDVLELARTQPHKLSYASQGNGTSAHLAGEMFDHLARVHTTHIPYRGAGPAMSDLLGGQVDMMFATAAAVAPHIANGKLRALGVTSAERSAATWRAGTACWHPQALRPTCWLVCTPPWCKPSSTLTSNASSSPKAWWWTPARRKNSTRIFAARKRAGVAS